MRILFIRPNVVLPELYAGTELTLHWLCRSLIANGHDVVVVATTLIDNSFASVHRECGYLVFRSWNGHAAAIQALREFQPDVLVASQAGSWLDQLPNSIRRAPIVIYEQEASVSVKHVPPDFKTRAVFLVNSASTAAHVAREYGVDGTIVRPLFGIDEYVGIKRSGDAVLFVSLQRRKGADIVIRIAGSRPHVPFLFIESWTENKAQTAQLREEAARLANITLLPNQQGLFHIMPKIKLHLMPSRSQEGWGRTATEAQICGIPVLASCRGNLPRTIGPGGMTLDPDDPFEHWLENFDAIMNDAVLYDDLSTKAAAHALGVVKEAKQAYDIFERALHEAIAKARP